MSTDFNSFPVAPEFIDVLAENAVTTATDYLVKTGAPEELILLVENISNLNYYLRECYRDPKGFAGGRADRFDIETMVIEAVDAIAKLGGEFHGPFGSPQPREGTPLAERAE